MRNITYGLLLAAVLILAALPTASEAAAAQPDLIVSMIKIYPTVQRTVYVPADGSFVKVGFTARIANWGLAAAPKSSAEVTLRLPTGAIQNYGFYGVKALAPGQSDMWPIINPPPLQMSLGINSKMAGPNSLIVCADALNQVQESLEGNNCARLFFTVKVR